jgi:hypothetical protein
VAERNERHLVFREAGRGVGAHCKSVGRLHGAEQHGVVGHDQGGNVIDEDDDVNAVQSSAEAKGSANEAPGLGQVTSHGPPESHMKIVSHHPFSDI